MAQTDTPGSLATAALKGRTDVPSELDHFWF
jgi:hypothetical protein